MGTHAGEGTGAHTKSDRAVAQRAQKRSGGGSRCVRLAKELKAEYGDGFTKTNLYNFTEFYKAFPEIFHAASGKFDIRLSWTHYRVLLQVNDPKARDWYLHEAAAQT